MKIAYFGGFYQAEHSMQISFKDAGHEIIFPRSEDFLEVLVPELQPTILASDLRQWIEEYNPDIIIHRYFHNDPRQFEDSGKMARELKIPFIVYRMETNNSGCQLTNIRPMECDLFLYAHQCDAPYIEQSNKDWWPYGVSSYERNMHLKRDIDIASIGRQRPFLANRWTSLKMFIEGAWHYRRKPITVFWPYVHPANDGLKYGLRLQNEYPLEMQAEIINRIKIAVNVETIWNIPLCYSHKLWQTMGCGTPTVSLFKEEYEDMFEGALIQIKDGLHFANILKDLEFDTDRLSEISRKSEEVLHRKYEWSKVFFSILKTHGFTVTQTTA